jgi:hypothetical protein
MDVSPSDLCDRGRVLNGGVYQYRILNHWLHMVHYHLPLLN